MINTSLRGPIAPLFTVVIILTSLNLLASCATAPELSQDYVMELREEMDTMGGAENSEKSATEGDRREANRYPVVLVYGFMGFDHLSFPDFFYWGGTWSMEQKLRELGFEVYTAKIGPVTSVYDRACELYAAIKGGQVDYGAAHSGEAGHLRFGRTYPGLVPDWGDVDPETGEVKKVHLVGHSMGGQTIRYLAMLLAQGSEEERSYHGMGSSQEDQGGAERGLSSLFVGGKTGWIHSILTISTPHDGTPLTRYFEHAGGLIKYFAGLLASRSASGEDAFFDLHMDHWEGAARPGEELSDFLERAVEEELWLTIQDFSYHDLSPGGAEELNRITPALPDIFYFSISNSRTRYSDLTGRWVPELGMILPLHPAARFLGDSENDGVVPLASMDGPKAGSTDRIIPWSMGRQELPGPGVWHHLGTYRLDHWQIHADMPLGADHPKGYKSLLDFYVHIVSFLQALPRGQ